MAFLGGGPSEGPGDPLADLFGGPDDMEGGPGAEMIPVRRPGFERALQQLTRAPCLPCIAHRSRCRLL